MPSYRTLLLFAPLALAATGSAQSVLLRFKPPIGKTAAYTMTMTMSQSAPGMPAPMTYTQAVPMSIRVVSRKGNITTLETKTGQAKVTLPAGSPMANMKAQLESAGSNVTSTTSVDELGNLKGLSTGSSNAAVKAMGNGMMQGAQGISYPTKALKAGDTWTSTMDLGKMMSAAGAGAGMKASGKLPIVYRLVSIEKRGGKTLAKLLMTMKGKTTMTMGAGAQAKGMDMVMSTAGTAIIDTATGLLVSMTNTSDTNMAIMGTNMKQHMVMTMKAR